MYIRRCSVQNLNIYLVISFKFSAFWMLWSFFCVFSLFLFFNFMKTCMQMIRSRRSGGPFSMLHTVTIAKIISFKNQGTATSSCISLINELCPREKKKKKIILLAEKCIHGIQESEIVNYKILSNCTTTANNKMLKSWEKKPPLITYSLIKKSRQFQQD